MNSKEKELYAKCTCMTKSKSTIQLDRHFNNRIFIVVSDMVRKRSLVSMIIQIIVILTAIAGYSMWKQPVNVFTKNCRF